MAVAAIGVLTTLAAGCSSSASAPPLSPGQVVQLAATTTGNVNSFDSTVDMHMTVMTASGSVPIATSLTMTEQVHPSLLAKIVYPPASGQSFFAGSSEILTHSMIYIKSTQLSQEFQTSKPWIGIPLSLPSAKTGINLKSLLSQAGSSNPLSQARLLAVAKNVKTVGTGTVAGVPVTEYSGTYSMAAALAKLPASLRTSLSADDKQLGISSGTVAFKVWIDGEHNVRKEATNITATKFTESLTVTVNSINQPVTITVPPASQVYDLSSALNGANG